MMSHTMVLEKANLAIADYANVVLKDGLSFLFP